MVHSLTITLEDHTFAWLARLAAAEQMPAASCVVELLKELANPDAIERHAIRVGEPLSDAKTASITEELVTGERHAIRVGEPLSDAKTASITEELVTGERHAIRVGEPLSDAKTASITEELVTGSKPVWG